MSGCDIKNSFIRAKFLNRDNTSNIYPGQIQFFLQHTISTNKSQLEYKLAFVRWYKPANNTSTRFYFGFDEQNKRLCNVELWENEFYRIGRDCLILIHHILDRFIKVSYCKSTQKSSKEYIAVVLLHLK